MHSDAPSFSCAVASALVLLGSVVGVPAQDSPEEPLELGVEERIDIDYVLVDFVVLDSRDRPVGDLELENFKLKAGGKKIQAATLDRSCADELPGDRRRPSDEPPDSTPAGTPGAEPLRIVLVFDYDHMNDTAEIFDRAQDLLDNRPTGREEHMLVSFGEVVRFETPFTTDLDELRWALRRMRNDRDLFARHRQGFTGFQFYDRVRALFNLLDRWPGRKAVVLLSGPVSGGGFMYDEQYRELAALSTATRTAVYPVDTRGLATAAALGGSPALRRLANATGGRMTSDTNDIGMGYGRAQQDLSCTYTLGFHDPRLKLDRDRRMTIKIKGRKGLRVVYPDYYVVRSEDEKRSSLFETAALAPHMFESERVRSELIVTGARNASWESVVGTEIRLEPGALQGPGEMWDLRGYLRKPNGTVVHKFARVVAMPDNAERPIVAWTLEKFEVPPGDYALSVVLSDPRGEPFSSTQPVTLPALPKHGPFLIGPILGRNVETFEPLMGSDAPEDGRLDALTVFCLAGGGGGETRSTVTRRVADLAGNEVQRLEDVSVDLKGGGLRCSPVVDSLDALPLAPGSYELGAAATASDWMTDESATEFTVLGEEEME